MKNINSIISAYLALADFIIPIPLTFFMLWLWTRTESIEFSLAVILLGLVFGYTVPSVAARFFRLWEFTWPFRFKYCYYHHGFIYSGYLSLMLWLIWSPVGIFTLSDFLSSAVYCFIAMAAIGVHHDYFGLRVGMIINHTKTLKTGESVLKYITPTAITCFGLIGLFYYLSAYWGFYLYKTAEINPMPYWSIWLVLSAAFMSLSILPYVLLHRNHIKKVFAERKKQ